MGAPVKTVRIISFSGSPWSTAPNETIRHLASWPLVELLPRYLITLVKYPQFSRRLVTDIDWIYRYPIFEWVDVIWQGCQGTSNGHEDGMPAPTQWSLTLKQFGISSYFTILLISFPTIVQYNCNVSIIILVLYNQYLVSTVGNDDWCYMRFRLFIGWN